LKISNNRIDLEYRRYNIYLDNKNEGLDIGSDDGDFKFWVRFLT